MLAIDYKLSTIILITLFVSSCTKCPCIDFNISPNFIGFVASDADTVIIRKYSKNTGFSILIDTAFFEDKSSIQIEKKNDTITFPYRPSNFSIDKDHDWTISLPSINRLFKISNIISPQVS